MEDNTKRKFWFTAGELIEILKTFPENLPVVVSGYETGYENPYHPEIITVRHEPDNLYFEGEFQTAGDKDEEIFKVIKLERNFRDD